MNTTVDSIKPLEQIDFIAEDVVKGRTFASDVIMTTYQSYAYVLEENKITGYLIFSGILFLFIGVAIWLQITLSKNKNKWLGLILPLLNFAYSITAIFPLFKSITLPQYYEKFDKYGKLIETVTVEVSYNILGFILKIFFICNITTLIFCIIYWVYRNKRRQEIQ